MIIKKKGNYLIAYAEQGDNEGRSQVGDSLGKISLKTGKFTGNTCCMIKLQEEYDKVSPEEKLEKLIERVIELIRKDINNDWDAISELLKSCPKKNLIAFLPEEEWINFK